jgi:hypothetical protein
MPRRAVDLLACWNRRVGRNDINIVENNSFFLNVVHLERKKCFSFDDRERMSSDLWTCFLKSLFEWISTTAFLSISSYVDFCSLFSRS